MKRSIILCLLLIFSCKSDKKEEQNREAIHETKEFSEVVITTIFEADSLSIRAIEIIGNNLAFAANHGAYGLYNSETGEVKTSVLQEYGHQPEFRAVASTATDFFVLSAGNPALLYKTGDSGEMEVVYREEGEKVFYDSMIFWNDREGIAMGDPTQDCLSVIITRDGGETWAKLECDRLPETAEGEAAFAASNSNIAVHGDHTWIISGGKRSRVFYSSNKGENWDVFETPLVQGEETTGGYSIDFFDKKTGIIVGGDYLNPEEDSKNKAVTTDGGRTWELVAQGETPGYVGSVRYVPGSGGKQVVATEASGIFYSKDGGKGWEEISEEGFSTLRFMDSTSAYAAGDGRIALLEFKLGPKKKKPGR